MKIQVNGEVQDINEEKITVFEVIKKNNVKMPEMVSVQLNGNFVERDKFEEALLNDGDEIEFVYFMGGGSH